MTGIKIVMIAARIIVNFPYNLDSIIKIKSLKGYSGSTRFHL